MINKTTSNDSDTKDFEGFAGSCHVMTLAVSKENMPWTAPVYYIYSAGKFWFFSSPDSRHIIEAALNSGSAAASVYADPHDWSEIKGLQMTGKIRDGRFSSGSALAFAKYLAKFSFVKNMLKGSERMGLSEFQAAFRAAWYFFEPDVIYYSDNSKGFGFRYKVKG